MPKRSSKKSNDANEIAKTVVDLATAESAPEGEPAPERVKNAAAVELGRLGGKKGGAARAKKLTKEQRSVIAKKAAAARWAKKKDVR